MRTKIKLSLMVLVGCLFYKASADAQMPDFSELDHEAITGELSEVERMVRMPVDIIMGDQPSSRIIRTNYDQSIESENTDDESELVKSGADAVEKLQNPSSWIVNDASPELLRPFESEHAQKLLNYVNEICDESNIVERLSLHGRDVINFIRVATHYKFDVATLDAGLRKYYNTFKKCLIIDDTVAQQLISTFYSELPDYIDYEKNASTTIGLLQRSTEQVLCEGFARLSDLIPAKPNEFVTRVARSVAKEMYKSLDGEESFVARYRTERERLRNLIRQTVELLLSKTVWPVHAVESIWPSFMRIGSDICTLTQKNIVTHMDDFKDLYASLVHRFIFFIDLHATYLPSDMLAMIEKDLENKVIFFLEYPEHADLRADFERGLKAAMLKSIAYERGGIIS